MSVVSSVELIDAIRRYGLVEQARLRELVSLQERIFRPRDLARELVRRNWLTDFQAEQILQGNARDLVLGSYVLLGRLGKGGMGEVFKANHQLMNRVVAIKLIRPEFLSSPQTVSRFKREIRTAAKLSHPHI